MSKNAFMMLLPLHMAVATVVMKALSRMNVVYLDLCRSPDTSLDPWLSVNPRITCIWWKKTYATLGIAASEGDDRVEINKYICM
jgi:hypothetical protein